MLEKDVLVPSNSAWCSPIVLIKKSDWSPNNLSYRFCVDYRNLNRVTVKDKYPLPLIADLLDRFSGYSWFSTCNLKSGFWQLPLDPASAKKTAFQTNESLYHFATMPFGVVNGTSSFGRLMDMILRSLPCFMNYIDDCIIFSKTLVDHKRDVKTVLQRLN